MTAIPERMFENCDALTEIVLPAGIKTVGRFAFAESAALAKFTFNEGVETLGNSLFLNCEGLMEVKFSSTMTEITEGMFSGCKKLQKTIGDTAFVIPGNIKVIGKDAFKNCSSKNLKTITFNEGLEVIGDNAFEGCSRVTAIVLPSTVKTIGKEAFLQCSAVKTFDMLIAADAEIGENIFKNTSKLETIKVKEGTTAETYAKAWVKAEKEPNTFSSKLQVTVAK
jgi:hypothetical protein